MDRGVSLTHPRAQRDAVWLVRHGAFKVVSLTSSGRETVVSFRLPGDLLFDWDAPQSPVALRTVALTESALCRLTPPADAEGRIGYWRRIARRTRDALAQLLDPWRSLSANARVERFIDTLSQRLPRGADGLSFDLPMTPAEMGSYLGLSEESTCRAMRALHRSGRYRIENRRIQPLPRRRSQRIPTSCTST